MRDTHPLSSEYLGCLDIKNKRVGEIPGLSLGYWTLPQDQDLTILY